MKRIRFWGTRGSLPVSLTAAGGSREGHRRAARRVGPRRSRRMREVDAYVDGLGLAVAGTYGGHTSCVEIETGGAEYVLCDLGSGVRPFGQAALARHGPASPQTYHVFVSHLHWDHIMGLPFFTPAYIPGNRIRFYGGHAGARGGAAPPAGRRRRFPVDFSYLRADIEFVHLEPGRRYDIAGMAVDAEAPAPRRAIPTATGSSPAAGPSSTRPIPSTSSTTRRRPTASSSSSATPTS